MKTPFVRTPQIRILNLIRKKLKRIPPPQIHSLPIRTIRTIPPLSSPSSHNRRRMSRTSTHLLNINPLPPRPQPSRLPMQTTRPRRREETLIAPVFTSLARWVIVVDTGSFGHATGDAGFGFGSHSGSCRFWERGRGFMEGSCFRVARVGAWWEEGYVWMEGRYYAAACGGFGGTL